jgi:DNA gyrase subunit A
MRLAEGDKVIALAVLRHVDATVEERSAYLKLAAQKRRAMGEDADAPNVVAAGEEEEVAEISLSPERVAELEAAEQFLLAVTDGGFGKRSSAYEFRVTGRGGQGIGGITLSKRTGTEVVASFTVQSGDHIMLMTSGSQTIRFEAQQVRQTGRLSQGVMLQRLDDGERVTSCFPVIEDDEETVEE